MTRDELYAYAHGDINDAMSAEPYQVQQGVRDLFREVEMLQGSVKYWSEQAVANLKGREKEAGE